MKKPVKKTFADLRPGPTIKCFNCDEDKPEAGSTKFRAHRVCGDCTQKLQAKDRRAVA